MLLKFKKKIYPITAILHTCNLFNDSAYFEIDENNNEVKVTTTLKNKTAAKQNSKVQKLAEEFKNELINQTLRLKIVKENKKIRELIIEQALCAALPQPPPSPGELPVEEQPLKDEDIDRELEEILKEVEEETEDYQNDPLGIAVPWEEKYAKKEKPKKDQDLKNSKTKEEEC